jgi:hypothetical protein
MSRAYVFEFAGKSVALTLGGMSDEKTALTDHHVSEAYTFIGTGMTKQLQLRTVFLTFEVPT